tara:strand:- start:1662 stop:2312 length:651 start_codon:yes stop_codon:yes gene_type:complete
MYKFELLQKYSNEFNEMMKNSVELINCGKKNCKIEFKELQKYKNKIFDKISKLNKKEQKTISYKKFDLIRINIEKNYREHKYVKEYLEKVRIGIKPNDKNIVNFNKQFLIYQKNMKKNFKNYAKTVEKKNYNNETKKLLNMLHININVIKMQKCSLKKCLELHKKDLNLVKNFAEKMCKEKQKKSCKIYKMIDKLDFTKITYNDNMKILKLIRKGM